MATDLVQQEKVQLNGEEIFVPDNWSLWSSGADTASSHWKERTDNGQEVLTTTRLDDPFFFVKSPVVRTYPGLYFSDYGRANDYVKDLEIILVMPTTLDGLLDSDDPATQRQREDAEKIFNTSGTTGVNREALRQKRGTLCLPNGTTLVRLYEQERAEGDSPRRIVYIPLAFYYEYQRLEKEHRVEK